MLLTIPNSVISFFLPGIELNSTWNAQQWSLLVVGAYVVGHILYGLSAFILNRLYPFYWNKLATKGTTVDVDELKNEVVKLLEERSVLQKRGHINEDILIRRTKAILQAGYTNLADELTRIEAIYKLFRSLTLVFVIEAVIVLNHSIIQFQNTCVWNWGWLAAIIWLVLSLAMVWRFFNRRKEHERRTYEFLIAVCANQPD